jgi:hypothetical protein
VSYLAYYKLTDLSLEEAEEIVLDWSTLTVTEFWRKHMGRVANTRNEILSIRREMKQYTLGRYK